MISFIRGTLYAREQDSILIDVNGIGYTVNVHTRTFLKLPAEGEPVFVYTYLQVTENELKLYGFLDQEELALFRKLLGVSGMGAKGAMSILAAMTPESFGQAILSQDTKVLTKIPGIGKKSAERLIFELKDKMSDIAVKPSTGQVSVINELSEALEALGYKQSEVYPLIRDMEINNQLADSLEDNIRLLLKKISQQKLR